MAASYTTSRDTTGATGAPALPALILDALRDRLMQPDAVAAFIEEFTIEWNRLQLEASAQVAA